MNASLAADAGFVVLLPLAAMVYASAGRHPLAGLAASFAGVSGGFSANLLVTSLDPLLSGLTEAAARMVDADAVVPPTCNWWFMIASTFLLTAVGAVVTTRVVEPRLGAWTGDRPDGGALSAGERRGMAAAGLAAVAVLGLAAVAVATGILRDGDSLKPFYDALIVVLALAFGAAGVAYGAVAGTVRTSHDVARLSAEAMATMGGYLVLAFVAAQFVSWFSWSNLGIILAVTGAETLRDLGLGGVPLLVAFVVFAACVNLLVASASAKWAVMAPVFVPMLMLLGVPPEVTQAAYRVGDSVANVITPMMPYFPLVIAVAVKYDARAGLGTLLAMMLPYSAAFFAAWSVLLGAWVALGLPFGPGL
ncbi:MAG: AbgT family transporter [Myxococcota bacterium]